jgi:very-short-patch-repair endonuclease
MIERSETGGGDPAGSAGGAGSRGPREIDPVLRRLARDQWVRLHGTPRVTVLVGGTRGREIWSQWLALSGVAGTLLEAEAGGRDDLDGSERGDLVDEQIRAAVARAVAEPGHPIAVVVSAEAAQRWRAGRRDRLAAMVDEGWLAVPEEAASAPRARAVAGGGTHASVLDGGVGDERGAGGGDARGAYDGEVDGRSGGDATGMAGRDRGFHGDARGAHDGEVDGRSSGEAIGGGERAPGGRAPGAAGRDRAFHVDARSLAEATLFEALEATPATAGRFRLNESLAVRFGPTAAEVDLLSRGDRIAIEIDGVHHFADPECYRRDRRKDLLLQTHGFVVVRLLAEDVVRDVRAAVTAVSQALAYRLGEGRG